MAHLTICVYVLTSHAVSGYDPYTFRTDGNEMMRKDAYRIWQSFDDELASTIPFLMVLGYPGCPNVA